MKVMPTDYFIDGEKGAYQSFNAQYTISKTKLQLKPKLLIIH